MAKRVTAAKRRERDQREEERYGRQFLREVESATTFEQLWKLANNGRVVGRPGDRYHHWLGCALHGNPYDSAPEHVVTVIRAAVELIRKPDPKP